MLGVQHMLPAWAVGAGLFFLAVVAYLAYSVLAPDVIQQIEKNRLDRYFRYNMVRSFFCGVKSGIWSCKTKVKMW